MSEHNDVLVQLAQLSEAVSGLRRESDLAAVSRKETYGKMEQTNTDVATLAHELKSTNERLERLTDTLETLVIVQTQQSKDVAPIVGLSKELPLMVESWRTMSKWSRRLVYLLTVGGVSIVGAIYWFGTMITEAAKHWLGIVPPH